MASPTLKILAACAPTLRHIDIDCLVSAGTARSRGLHAVIANALSTYRFSRLEILGIRSGSIRDMQPFLRGDQSGVFLQNVANLRAITLKPQLHGTQRDLYHFQHLENW